MAFFSHICVSIRFKWTNVLNITTVKVESTSTTVKERLLEQYTRLLSEYTFKSHPSVTFCFTCPLQFVEYLLRLPLATIKSFTEYFNLWLSMLPTLIQQFLGSELVYIWTASSQGIPHYLTCIHLFLSYRYIAPSGITSITSTKYIVEDNYVILSYHNREINKNLQSMNLPASAQTVQVAGRSHIADLLHTGNGVLARRFATE